MGQLILVKKQFPYAVDLVHRSDRILAIDILLDDKTLHLVNVYAPCQVSEKEKFVQQLSQYMSKLSSENIVLCGDFNCVLDNRFDIISGEDHCTREVERLQQFSKQFQLSDVWRLFNGNKKEYTWSKRNPFIARRLDYILVSDNIMNSVQDCVIESMAQSDHRQVIMTYRVTNIVRGPSYWKFNDRLLEDTEFVKIMNNFIKSFIENSKDLDAQNRWDLCKIKIKELCISYSKEKRQRHRNKYLLLHDQLNEIETLLSSDPKNETLLKKQR